MKIGLLSREYPPLTHVGGIATYSAAAAELLAREGHEVHVVCNGSRLEVSRRRGVTVHRVPMLSHHFTGGRLFYPYRAWYRRTLPHYLDALTWARTAARYLEEELDPSGFDAWEYPETAGEGALFPAPRPGRRAPRLVCRVHSSWMDGFADNALERRLLLRLQRAACLRADRIVSPSAYMAGGYVRDTLRLGRAAEVSRNPLALWDDPIDWDAKAPGHLLFVGRVEHRKGLQVLLRALDSLGEDARGITLRVAGHMYPPTREADAECIRSFQAHRDAPEGPGGRHYALEYAGPCDHSRLAAHYDWAGAVILPSLMENYPYVALEALSRGCYVIGSAVGGIPEIIDRPERGALFPPENSAILGRKIREWRARNPSIPPGMRDVAAALRAEFAPDACARRLLETYGADLGERVKP
jgi:glycosyltransferase involved in cell wall biosynthesis